MGFSRPKSAWLLAQLGAGLGKCGVKLMGSNTSKAGNWIRLSQVSCYTHTQGSDIFSLSPPRTTQSPCRHRHKHGPKTQTHQQQNPAENQRFSSLVNTLQVERCLSQIRPTRLVFRFLGVHTQCFPEHSHLILQPADDLEFFSPLISPQPVGRPEHLAHFQRLRMPVITVKARLQVLVFFRLEEVVVVSALGEVIHVIIRAIIADLFGRGAKGIFVFADQLGVVALFGFEEFDGTVGFQELHFKFANLGRWEVIVSRHD
jgi:hypothetical protein